MATSTEIKKGIDKLTYDAGGMKEPSDLIRKGYKLEAVSSNGRNHVCSYIAKKNGKRVYGSYDCQKAAYIEEPCD